MKLLKTFTHPDFPTTGIEIDTRKAARIILVDKDGLVPLLYWRAQDVYNIPGWGIDKWEDILGGLIREAKEETGCDVEILWEIGRVMEERSAEWYIKWLNLRQNSYCFFGNVIQKWIPEFTESEISQWFELVWIPVEEVIQKMYSCSPNTLRAQLVKERDIFIFTEYYKHLLEYKK